MIKLRKLKESDTKAVALLIADTFKKFNHNEYYKKSGVQWFINSLNLKKHSLEEIYTAFQRSPISFVATLNNKIVGIIRGRKDRIVNLFVDGRYHNQRIGSKLIKKYETAVKKFRPKQINIRASVYATPFYQFWGYKRTTGTRNFHGIKINPMVKKFK